MQTPYDHLDDADRMLALEFVEELERRKSESRLDYYRPYPKQEEFHRLPHRERALLAGNQLGKTYSAAAEVAMHLTGRYPEWWSGRRFTKAVRWIAGSNTGELTRKGVQRLLVGPPEDRNAWGTGMVPKDCLVDWSMRAGVADALANVVVKHVSGGNSICQFASYDQGRVAWQADTVDGVWFDEEPPEDIYVEGITRTNTTFGPIMATFTPLLGMSTVVMRFWKNESPDRAKVVMTIEDGEHYTPEERQKIIDSYPEHEREARTQGKPSLGSGRVFPIAEDKIKCAGFDIPRYWPQIAGIDFGWDHPTAAARLAWDREADIVYVTACYRVREATPLIHGGALKAWGDWLPWSWPHDGLQHDKGSGESLADQYREQGLNMLPSKATLPPAEGQLEGSGGNSVEAGLMMMLIRMQTGRFKVFDHLHDWFEEFSIYHRKDGKLVKEYDDLMSATRYGLVMLRFAECRGGRKGKGAFTSVPPGAYL